VLFYPVIVGFLRDATSSAFNENTKIQEKATCSMTKQCISIEVKFCIRNLSDLVELDIIY